MLISSFVLGLLFGAEPVQAHGNAWEKSLVFYASFDAGVDADRAGGDKKMYSAPKMAFPPEARPGLPESKVVTHEANGGVQGGCLRFNKKASEMVFFKAAGNMPYQKTNWESTVSFWLSLTPDEDLEPGYTDPIQITSKSWDNSAFFVEFTKDEVPREFRLGVYADKSVWNPLNRDWNNIPFKEKPLVAVTRPPFKRDIWTHVAFTARNFNSGHTNGTAELFLNGKSQGVISPREQTFSWDIEKAMIMLGLSYVGRFDELAIFNRTLTPAEIASIYNKKGVLSTP